MLDIYIDGSFNANKNTAGIGVFIYDLANKNNIEIKKALFSDSSYNVELIAFKFVKDYLNKYQLIGRIFTDNKGVYLRYKDISDAFIKEVIWIPRYKNEEANLLANAARIEIENLLFEPFIVTNQNIEEILDSENIEKTSLDDIDIKITEISKLEEVLIKGKETKSSLLDYIKSYKIDIRITLFKLINHYKGYKSNFQVLLYLEDKTLFNSLEKETIEILFSLLTNNEIKKYNLKDLNINLKKLNIEYDLIFSLINKYRK